MCWRSEHLHLKYGDPLTSNSNWKKSLISRESIRAGELRILWDISPKHGRIWGLTCSPVNITTITSRFSELALDQSILSIVLTSPSQAACNKFWFEEYSEHNWRIHLPWGWHLFIPREFLSVPWKEQKAHSGPCLSILLSWLWALCL